MKRTLLLLALTLVSTLTLYAEETVPATDTQKLAKQLQNPVAALISVPFQNNFSFDLGPNENGHQYLLRMQPVIPVSISEDWNLIVRPILPFVSQNNVLGPNSQTGFSDLNLELFFSPKETGEDGIIWGVGPVLLMPTATNIYLGTEKWGMGPAAVALKQFGPWTAGMLANHVWSYAGHSDRNKISLTYMQPFFAHASKKGFTVSCSSETSYDWIGHKWTVPLIGGVSQILPVFGHLISVGASGIYYARSPEFGPSWGIRATLTLLFPKH